MRTVPVVLLLRISKIQVHTYHFHPADGNGRFMENVGNCYQTKAVYLP